MLPNGHIVSGSEDDSLIVWDASDGRRVRQLKGHGNDARPRRAYACRRSGRLFDV